MGFNDDLATVSRYFSTTGIPLKAVTDLCRAVMEKEKDPDADIDNLLEGGSKVCRAIRLAKKGYNENEDRDYVIKEPAFYFGIEKVFKRELSSCNSEDFWKKWESRAEEIDRLTEQVRTGKLDSGLLNKMGEYMLELSRLAEKHLHREYRGASSAISGFPRIP